MFIAINNIKHNLKIIKHKKKQAFLFRLLKLFYLNNFNTHWTCWATAGATFTPFFVFVAITPFIDFVVFNKSFHFACYAPGTASNI